MGRERVIETRKRQADGLMYVQRRDDRIGSRVDTTSLRRELTGKRSRMPSWSVLLSRMDADYSGCRALLLGFSQMHADQPSCTKS